MEAAERMGVDPKTLMWWERDEKVPFVRAYPALIAFLGYEPWEEPATLAAALLAERRRRGLSRKMAASTLGVEESTFWRWETGQWKPMRRAANAVTAFLGYIAKDRFPAEVR